MVWAKKEFHVEDPDVFGATLVLGLYCEVGQDTRREDDTFIDTDPRQAMLLIEVNGRTIPFRWPKERRYWESGAFPVQIQVESLKPGLNEFVFHSADSTEWYLLIEDSIWPNRSAKSLDAGASWDYEHLGTNGGHDGEYLVRLQLEGHPPKGNLTSQALDLARLASGRRVGIPFTLKGIQIESKADEPDGTGVEFRVRGGSTPSYEPFEWTEWLPIGDLTRLVDSGPRFVQWRAILTTTSPKLTPILKEVTLKAKVEVPDERGKERFAIACDDTPTIARSSYHFAYQPYDEERLRIVRERWHLDQVIEGAESELEELVRLCDWTRQQWEYVQFVRMLNTSHALYDGLQNNGHE